MEEANVNRQKDPSKHEIIFQNDLSYFDCAINIP